MNLFVLSDLHPDNKHVGWSVSYSFEETLKAILQPTLIYPVDNQTIQLFNREFPDTSIAYLRRYRHRLFKSWFKVGEALPALPQGCNVLLVVGLNPGFLLSMHALGPLLEQFDLRLGYVLDGFDPQHIDQSVVPWLDHLFVIGAELAEHIEAMHPLKASCLPLATDVLNKKFNAQSRWIDIIGYGRSNPDLHKRLKAHFDRPEASHHTYYHSTFASGEVHDLREHISLLSQLLDSSKISLCFESSSTPRFMGHSPILYRWFEAWAAGCTIVGKKPFGQGVAELMDWENSAIDIPDSPDEWIPFLEELLSDTSTLQQNAQRNYREALLRHDWRYRLKTLFETVDLPIPARLNTEIHQLRSKAAEATPALQLAT